MDCRDAAALADFWARVLEREVDAGATEDFAAIGLLGKLGERLGYQLS